MKNQLVYKQIVSLHQNFIKNPQSFSEVSKFPEKLQYYKSGLVENNNLFDFLCSLNGRCYFSQRALPTLQSNPNIKITSNLNHRQDIGLIDTNSDILIKTAQIKMRISDKVMSNDKILNLFHSYKNKNKELIIDLTYPTQSNPNYYNLQWENIQKSSEVVENIIEQNILIISDNYVTLDIFNQIIPFL